MSSPPKLKLDWATHEAAKYACEHWHYSKCIPKSKLVKIGVWENDKYIGCVIFSYGANIMIGRPFGLTNQQCVELTRVALTNHESKVSKILAIAIKMLKRYCKNIRLIVSYADNAQEHIGTIYQANGWIYIGYIVSESWIINGKKEHPKTIFDRFCTRKTSVVKKKYPGAYLEYSKKYKYIYPLDDEMRKKVVSLSKPYPKRPKPSSEVPVDQTGEGSADSDLDAP